MSPLRLLQTVRATRRALTNAPVPPGWAREAAKTQLRLAAGRVRHEQGLVRVNVDRFDVAGFSVASLAYLHREIFVELQYYFSTDRPDPFIVDGGSNIGMSVLFFKALYPGARVLAFEPAQPAHDLLVRNVDANGLRDVEVHRAALGREDGEVPFFEDRDDPATFRMSTRSERLPGTASPVPQRRLSQLLREEVDLLKLDIEGSEDDVLAELVDSQAVSRIRQLVVEYHHQLDPTRDFLGAFLECLRQQGFGYQVSAKGPVANRAAAEPAFQDVLVHARRYQ
ncbi:MAG TPA: FkbM family methyltransferase [Gaiellaceae bacterium]